jgi:iron complex outermembrane receptor protein
VLGARGSWLNFAYTKFDAGIGPADIAAANEIIRPKFSYGLNGKYSLPLDPAYGLIGCAVDWSWIDKSAQIKTDPVGVYPPYGLLTVSANWDSIWGAPLDAEVFMTNALNKIYAAAGAPLASSGFGTSTLHYAEPRMFGLRLRYRVDPGK